MLPATAESTTAHPWDRQPGESPQAYAAFRFYLDLGPSRSLDAVGRKLYPTRRRPGKTRRKRGKTGRLETWSKRWRWVERALAYADHRFRREDRAKEREHKRFAVAQAKKWIERLEGHGA